MRIRRKPKTSKAIQYNGDNIDECLNFVNLRRDKYEYGYRIKAGTFEGMVIATHSSGYGLVKLGSYIYINGLGFVEVINEEDFNKLFDIIEG